MKEWIKRVWARTPWARLARVERNLAALVVCPSCGGVMQLGHNGTRYVDTKDGRVWICKWDHARLKSEAHAIKTSNRTRQH